MIRTFTCLQAFDDWDEELAKIHRNIKQTEQAKHTNALLSLPAEAKHI